MKKFLATLLVSIIGTSGIVCVDNEARELIAQNSEQINAYYSEYKEDYSNLSESITECSHICKNYDEDISNLNNKIDNIVFPECTCEDYSYLVEQYNELNSKYEELSLICEENTKKEYKVGDKVEIPVVYGQKMEGAVINKCYGIITEIDNSSIQEKYTIDVIVEGELKVPSKRTYTIWFVLFDNDDINTGQSTIRVEWPSNQTEKHILNNTCLTTKIDMLSLENGAMGLDISLQY